MHYDNHSEPVKSPNLVPTAAMLLIIFGMFIVLTSTYTIAEYLILLSESPIRTQALVTKVLVDDESRGYQIQFIDSTGRNITTVARGTGAALSHYFVGDKMNIVYDRENPAYAWVDKFPELNRLSLPVGAVMTGTGVFLIYQTRKFERSLKAYRKDGVFCRYCGNRNPSGSVFCVKCGKKIG